MGAGAHTHTRLSDRLNTNTGFGGRKTGERREGDLLGNARIFLDLAGLDYSRINLQGFDR